MRQYTQRRQGEGYPRGAGAPAPLIARAADCSRRENSGEGTRTLDTADMSRMLYHLSYAAVTVFAHGL